MEAKEYIKRMHGGKASERLAALGAYVAEEKESDRPVKRENDANNHIHTTFSFSPYSPTEAALNAYKSGLTSCGIMDHDTLAGAKEFSKACRMLGMGYTCGVEVRAKFDRGFGRINHPDQNDVIYMAAHGVPKQSIDAFDEYLRPFREKRLKRDRAMTDRINEKFGSVGVKLDFDADVLPVSEHKNGGTVTERHLLYALALKLERVLGRTPALIDALKGLGIPVGEKKEKKLTDPAFDDYFYPYELLGALKSDTSFFYIDADEELPDAAEFVKVAESFGAIPAYAYLGDVGDSVTGDKRAQKFEDAFLPELFDELKKIGMRAVAYMPTRNTPEQLDRVRALCGEKGFFEISGEDINSPSQSFECKALADEKYSNLITSTWALIGHERASGTGLGYGMFSEGARARYPKLDDRIKAYAAFGRACTERR